MDVTLNGETRLFYVIGDPIGQVKSPGSLTAIMVARGVNALVVPAHVAVADFPAFMAAAKATQNVDGMVVTVPHKIAALDFAEETSERTRFAGSTNVMRRLASGGWSAENTDGIGYLDGAAKAGFDPAGRTALLVGAGGAGSSIAYEILFRGATHLAIHDVDATRRDRVISRLAERFPGKVGPGSADPTGVDLVANATPLGMREGDPLPVEVAKLVATQFVADVITRPEISPLIAAARAAGCGTMPGSGMFNAQAELLVDRLLGTAS